MVKGSPLASVSMATESCDVRRAGNDERAHIDVGGHAHAGRIGHRVERALLLVVEGLDRAQRVERGERGRPRGDSAGFADGDAFAGEEFLRRRVDRRGPGECWNTITGWFGAAASSSAKRRQTFFRELRGDPAAHRGDPFARRHGLGPRRDRGLHVGDRGRGFKPRVVARPQAQQHE